MKEIEENKLAWGTLSLDHYKHFKHQFETDTYVFNPIIKRELKDIKGKKVLHLQCNTGADSIVLAKMGAHVTGVDLVPDNVHYARKLANDLGIKNVDFIESDIMTLMNTHKGKYDIVFTSDGAIGWLPDLNVWGKTIAHFLKDDGYFYAHDSHPFYLTFSEEKLGEDQGELHYPYFEKEVEVDDTIGGYATEVKKAKNNFWMYKMSDLINALSGAGLFVEYLHEHDRCAQGMGGTKEDEDRLYYHPKLEGMIPLTFSLKAVKR